MQTGQENKQPLALWNDAATFSAGLRAFFPLCSQILFRPLDFFSQLFSAGEAGTKKRFVKAITFALVLNYLKLFFDVANFYWFKFFPKGVFPAADSFQPSLLLDVVFSSPFFLLRPLLVFGLTVLLIFVGVKLIIGLDKMLLGAIFVICYRSAADLFYALPFIGGIFALAWSAALLVVGLREVYKTGFLRSIMAGVVVPVMLLFFILAGMGPVLNRAVLAFYPEMKGQLVKINDITAYATTSSIVTATGAYKKDLGFYPAHLGVLNKYVSDSVISDLESSNKPGGYIYQYDRLDDERYRLEARPKEVNVTGRFVFYADESGQIRFDGPQGQVIKDMNQVEEYVLGEK